MPTEVTDPKTDVGLTPATTATRSPHRVKGQLTREGMLNVVRNGGSFHWPTKDEDGNDAGFRVVQHEKDVPSEADVAQVRGDVAQADQARRSNDAEIERLRAENARLKSVQPLAPRPATAAVAAK